MPPYPSFFCGFWESKLRSLCLCDKHLINWATSLTPELKKKVQTDITLFIAIIPSLASFCSPKHFHFFFHFIHTYMILWDYMKSGNHKSGKTWNLYFWDWPYLLDRMIACRTCFPVRDGTPFFFLTGNVSTVHVHCLCRSVAGYLVCPMAESLWIVCSLHCVWVSLWCDDCSSLGRSGRRPGVVELDSVEDLFLLFFFDKPPYCFPQKLGQSIFQLTVYKGSLLSYILSSICT